MQNFLFLYFLLVTAVGLRARPRYLTTWNFWLHAVLIGAEFLHSDGLLGLIKARGWSVHIPLAWFVLVGSHVVMLRSLITRPHRFMTKWYAPIGHLLMHVCPAVVSATCFSHYWRPHWLDVFVVTTALYVYHRIYDFRTVYLVREPFPWDGS